MVSWEPTWGNLASTLPGGQMADVAKTNNGRTEELGPSN